MIRTGHFALLATDVEHLLLSRLTLRPTRDGLDLVGVRHVWAEHLDIGGGHDDAFVVHTAFTHSYHPDVWAVAPFPLTPHRNTYTHTYIHTSPCQCFSVRLFSNR